MSSPRDSHLIRGRQIISNVRATRIMHHVVFQKRDAIDIHLSHNIQVQFEFRPANEFNAN